MTNAASKLFMAGLLAALPANAQSAGKIRVCVNSGNYTSVGVVTLAEDITSRMLATAGVGVEWHAVANAVCREARQNDTVALDFAEYALPGQPPGALAYAEVYDAVHIVVLFDRVKRSANGPTQVSIVLAHVMTHEIAHLLEGIARHSKTGVMKAHWNAKDFALMGWSPLPFAPEDIELIRLGLVRRAARFASAAPVPTTVASR
jgi:hypothetical protein